MGKLDGRFRTLVLGIDDRETTFARRGFTDPGSVARTRLEGIGRTFLEGYHQALQTPEATALGARLDGIESERRGWAYEGAAMALTLLDALTPWRRRRLQHFLDGPGDDHAYMVHVGAGWALARLGRRPDRLRTILDPLFHWLVIDGWGFHEGYFRPDRAIEHQRVPGRFHGYTARVFDQGLGRCLWFVGGAEAREVSSLIERFPASRRDDLWSGVGLACAYAGGVTPETADGVARAAGAALPHAALGASFAAKARVRAGNVAPHTEAACGRLCGMSAADAAQITDAAREGVVDAGGKPAYEVWRARVREMLGGQEAAA